MKSGRTQVEIIALYEELGSYRAVGALLGCDHKTVKRYVRAAGEAGQPAPALSRHRATIIALRHAARHILALEAEANDLESEIERLVARAVPACSTNSASGRSPPPSLRDRPRPSVECRQDAPGRPRWRVRRRLR